MAKLAMPFKINYFRLKLESIEAQICQEFALYIGDDSSPADLKSIVNIYLGRINIKYIMFNRNLGCIDSVAHWDRCIDLKENGQLICLFSDVDTLYSTYAESFYKTIKLKKELFKNSRSLIKR